MRSNGGTKENTCEGTYGNEVFQGEWEPTEEKSTTERKPAGEKLTEEELTRRNLLEQNTIVEENVGLVYWVLKRFAGRGYDMEELFQVGTVGLVKAARRFDPGRETAFSTYAVPVIIGEIRRFLRDDGMIHISRKIKEDAAKIAFVREQMEKTENRQPTVEEMSDTLGLGKEEVILAIGSMGNVASIYEPVTGERDGKTGGEWTMEDQLMHPRDEQEALIDRLTVRQLIEELDERSRTLISLRYFKGMTQFQTAKQMGMNQVAVSRMEKKILLHFRGKF
jgi:RNA polymerase sporulation-specific sigma factor